MYKTDAFTKKFLTSDQLPARSANEVRMFREKLNITIKSSHTNVLNPIVDFNECKVFPNCILDEIRKNGFSTPTPI